MLDWLLPRRQAIKFLAADIKDGEKEHLVEFTRKEVDMITEAIDDNQSPLFWAKCNLCFQLAEWGGTLSRFLHSCPLQEHFLTTTNEPCKNCSWKGRMAVRLAQGSWLDEFAQSLLNMPNGPANNFLGKVSQQDRDTLLNEYAACKVSMAQRFIQSFGFWREIPWRICAIACSLFYGPEHAAASKAFANDVLEQWATYKNKKSGHASFHVARRFLDNSYPGNLSAYVVYWASSLSTVTEMPDPLAQELLKYCSSLTVMQSLEAQHHFLNMKVSFGRASLPASTCAFLRRRVNDDVRDPLFRMRLSHLFGRMSKLVVSEWDKRTESWSNIVLVKFWC